MDFRYLLEHELLPKTVLSENGKRAIIMLAQDCGGMLVDFMNSVFGRFDKNYRCPYSVEDFAVVTRSFDRSDEKPRFFVHRVIMPEPEAPPQCFCVFVCHDADFENVSYYTLEKSFDDSRCLCGWSESGAHFNYGTTDDDPEALTERLAEWYYQKK